MTLFWEPTFPYIRRSQNILTREGARRKVNDLELPSLKQRIVK